MDDFSDPQFAPDETDPTSLPEGLDDVDPTTNVDAADEFPPHPDDLARVEEASTEYLGRWNRLVSTTNWEKGRIIHQWRQALIDADAPVSTYTDEAWSRRVGNVTPQHTGRLRRVYQRFGDAAEQYDGLYWSHFQAALDWSDAEMWLEGAVQNGWSVAGMRQQRWEATGAPADKKPREEDIITAEIDEDVDPDPVAQDTIHQSLGEVQNTEPAEFDPAADVADADFESDVDDSPDDLPVAEPVRPFEHLAPLPADMHDAFEAFKLAIIQHKLAGWQEISLGAVVAALDALKQLAMTPAEGS